MNKIEILQGGKTVIKAETPSTWNELSADQMRYYLTQKMVCKDPLELLEKVSFYFIGKIPAQFPGLTKGQLEEICKPHLFLFETSNLSKQLLPVISTGGNSFYGPSDGLTNLKFWEFLKANDAFLKHQKSKRSEELDRFIACIYRPKKTIYIKDPDTYTGDEREKFNENLLDERTQMISTIDASIKEGISIFWKGCNQLLELRFPEAFQEGGFKNEYGAYGFADMMAGPKFGTIDQVKDAWLYEVLVSVCNLEKMRMLNKK